jgi:hypothetical protein
MSQLFLQYGFLAFFILSISVELFNLVLIVLFIEIRTKILGSSSGGFFSLGIATKLGKEGASSLQSFIGFMDLLFWFHILSVAVLVKTLPPVFKIVGRHVAFAWRIEVSRESTRLARDFERNIVSILG